MNVDDEVCEINECKHIFHTECLNRWLEQKNECPLCKAQIDCYKPNAGNGQDVAITALVNQLFEMNGPLAEYIRGMRQLHTDLESFNQFRMRRPRNQRTDRDFAVGMLALHAQLRNIQSGLVMNRRGNVRPIHFGNFPHDI